MCPPEFWLTISDNIPLGALWSLAHAAIAVAFLDLMQAKKPRYVDPTFTRYAKA